MASPSTRSRKTAKPTPKVPAPRLYNRDLSWMDFNERVLELASDIRLPVLERVRFCSIFSANLDEFFMVRVAGLLGQASTGISVQSPDGLTARETLAMIRERVLELTRTQSKVWSVDTMPNLESEGIFISKVADCSQAEIDELKEFFTKLVYPILTPLAVGPGQPFPYISGLSLSLAVKVRDPKTSETRFARVKVPESLPRFIKVGLRKVRVWVEDLISHFLPLLFPGMEVIECAVFRVTRDADLEVSDEADDLLEAVQLELRRRRFGDVVRLEVADEISSELLDTLTTGLDIDEHQVTLIDGQLDLSELAQLLDIDRPILKFPPWTPVTPGALIDASPTDIFTAIRAQDLLVQHPYDSFETSVEAFVKAAAKDPHVIGLKTTVYRTSEASPLVPALVDSAEQGKQSVCLVELKARFDERRNIDWSQRLEKAGVHVVYGFPSLKIHAKTTLIVRREAGELRRYVHIGTGNYHSLTAQIYEDLGLFTADEAIAEDVAELFNYLTGFGRPQKFRKLWVAPFTLRTRLQEKIQEGSEHAAKGVPSRIRIKVNSLTDPGIIEHLYAASAAGVKIEIIARSTCSLRPGVEGLSENIRVISVLGRFLEHSRYFYFESGGKKSLFIGSADLMTRNLDHRVEVVVPIEDARHQQQVMDGFESLLEDRAGSWELRPDGHWERLHPKKGESALSSQETLMKRARARAVRRAAARRTVGKMTQASVKSGRRR